MGQVSFFLLFWGVGFGGNGIEWEGYFFCCWIDGMYGNFAGRDASRGMAKQSFDLGQCFWRSAEESGIMSAERRRYLFL